ncbi:UNVERIFIED_CONTAM: hypothetical protein GTU68_026838 [Idotea baltica]|nr:hypothetical protein [Idotea baltica]
MVCAVNRAIEEGKPMYDPKYFSNLTLDTVKQIFRSDTESQMPLLEKRVEAMGEIGSILTNKFGGSFKAVIDKAQGSAFQLVKIVAAEFPCFKDVHSYEGESVAILKRAQILAADLELLYASKGMKVFSDIDELTMFADYRVPQSLVHFGVMSYSHDLLQKLDQDYLFNSGDREEVEIRGVSIHATELIVAEVRKILLDRKAGPDMHINSIKVDFFLWDYRVEHAQSLESIPYHKTRCIYY